MSTDRELAGKEVAELHRQVTLAFENADALPPALLDANRQPRLRVWERPAFANHRSWVVWGGVSESGLLRRINWRRDIDVVRADPVQRLALLGTPVRATLEVRDGQVNIDELSRRLGELPTIRSADVLRRNRAIHIDGGHYGAELDDGSSRYRYESMDRWTAAVCDWLDACLDDG